MKIQPVEFKVLIKLDPVEEVSKGGIVISTGSAKEREQMAQVKGELLAVGGNAFEDFADPKPEVGQRVMIAKYAGVEVEDEGEKYRLCNDKDVAAIID